MNLGFVGFLGRLGGSFRSSTVQPDFYSTFTASNGTDVTAVVPEIGSSMQSLYRTNTVESNELKTTIGGGIIRCPMSGLPTKAQVDVLSVNSGCAVYIQNMNNLILVQAKATSIRLLERKSGTWNLRKETFGYVFNSGDTAKITDITGTTVSYSVGSVSDSYTLTAPTTHASCGAYLATSSPTSIDNVKGYV